MNNIISIYELLGLIKDGKVPKKIKYENIIWKHNLEENKYIEENEDYCYTLSAPQVVIVNKLNQVINYINRKEDK